MAIFREGENTLWIFPISESLTPRAHSPAPRRAQNAAAAWAPASGQRAAPRIALGLRRPALPLHLAATPVRVHSLALHFLPTPPALSPRTRDAPSRHGRSSVSSRRRPCGPPFAQPSPPPRSPRATPPSPQILGLAPPPLARSECAHAAATPWPSPRRASYAAHLGPPPLRPTRAPSSPHLPPPKPQTLGRRRRP